jgi:hypothetical protein
MKAAGHFPGRCALNSVERTWRNASTDVAVVKTNRTRAHVAFTPWAESNQTEVVGNWRKTTLFHNNLPSIGCIQGGRKPDGGRYRSKPEIFTRPHPPRYAAVDFLCALNHS